MNFLFVKASLAWPRSAGHEVHTYYMMRSLASLGHRVALVTFEPTPAEAVAGCPLVRHFRWDEGDRPASTAPPLQLSRFQERFRSYWGIDPERIRGVGAAARELAADVVVVAGLEVLPYLGAVETAQRVWYAGDEWFWHHLSQVRLLRRRSWENAREAIVKGLYERAYGPLVDRIWVVSEVDGRAMRWVAGKCNIDVIPNGVDIERYAPLTLEEVADSLVFWGRLDFGPNLDALEWFVHKVWPRLREKRPAANLTIYGFAPTDQARALANQGGIRLVPNLEDLRPEIARAQVVVLPFVSGGGIKNKLLEAAAMARPIVVSRVACNGLVFPDGCPLAQAGRPKEWVERIVELWDDEKKRRAVGRAARAWVEKQHSWTAAAAKAIEGLEHRSPAALRVPGPRLKGAASDPAERKPH